MKLVNVEDLKVLVAVESKGEIRYGKLVTDLFEDIPTVKAIPIEWLKKFANERAKNEDDEGYWHYWGTDLLQMIEQWEKENEGL